MSFNNAALIHALEQGTEVSTAPETLTIPTVRRRVASDPCLPERLPNTSYLKREAESLAPNALRKAQSLHPPSSDDSDSTSEVPSISTETVQEDEASDEPLSPVPSVASESNKHSTSFLKNIVKSISAFGQGSSAHLNRQWSDVQPFEIMRAVEQSNLMFLMEVRDKAFPLLLRTTGGQTPLVHAIRIGNKEVAIVLLGAFSRYINHLEEEDIAKPQTQSQLKALRTGLKLAINQGLAKKQPDLIASFMQTLIMSEGDKWVWAQVANVARELNAGAEGTPVAVAGAAVRKFATRELGKADLIASLEDYIANATADLLILAAWSIVLQSISSDHISSSYFARDDRIYKAFTSRLDRYKKDIDRRCPRQLRLQLRILREGFEGRNTTFRKKVESVAAQLDSGDIALHI